MLVPSLIPTLVAGRWGLQGNQRDLGTKTLTLSQGTRVCHLAPPQAQPPCTVCKDPRAPIFCLPYLSKSAVWPREREGLEFHRPGGTSWICHLGPACCPAGPHYPLSC